VEAVNETLKSDPAVETVIRSQPNVVWLSVSAVKMRLAGIFTRLGLGVSKNEQLKSLIIQLRTLQ